MTVESDNTLLPGVKKVELLKKVWSALDMWIIFSGLILLSFSSSWESNLSFTLLTYVTSLFEANNYMSILSTVTYILQSVLFPSYSKLSDLVGRVEVFSMCMVFYILSYIVMATAQSFAAIVGGQILYTFGYSGVMILGPILVGDMTNVVTRGFYQGLYSLPQLINLFVPTIVGQSLIDQGRWRWAYGHLPLVLLVANLPLVYGLWIVQRKIFKEGLYLEYKQARRRQDNHRSILESIKHYLVAIDFVGCILLVGSLTMTLLPLVLALYTWGGWGNSRVIGTICGGGVCWVLLGIWEWKFATKPLIPMGSWPNRTPIWGVLATSTVTIISSTEWQYLITYFQVTRRIDNAHAVLLGRGYNVAYIVVQLVIGWLMMKTRVWRPYVWAGISLMILGVGLLYAARWPSSSDAFIVIAQTIVGIGSGMMDIPITVAVQSSVPHNDLAMVTALYQLGGSIAASIGSTMSGAIWNNMLPQELARHAPDVDILKVIGSVEYAQNLPDEQHSGVVLAYAETQRVLNIIALCVSVLTFAFTLPMKSFGLSEYMNKQSAADAEEKSCDNCEEKTEHEDHSVTGT
ncbi:major facilitator superfamily domain-containing protein [Zychaea mexicana]|uniref:major facilitator superfamily domain-containing protein n=1 Tax=Zychaea mexicana TaxID=64656 RepID=UPI0022FDE22D|nr:major facilitator superfamily domain-containing protein [Zychaea mexicana]KAI9492606.1 major facilitator superfamily domain-containing protein [Zychaea mexicana]